MPFNCFNKDSWVLQSHFQQYVSVHFFFPQVKDVRDHKLDNRMESFFLAETVKYLYLLFDPDNFLHNGGLDFEMGTGPQSDCVLGAGGYVYNTEAHPLDPAALHCCSQAHGERRELQDILLSLSESLHRPPAAQPEESTGDAPTHCSESIAIKPGTRRKVPLLSCPMQPFSSRLSILGQVFPDSTWRFIHFLSMILMKNQNKAFNLLKCTSQTAVIPDSLYWHEVKWKLEWPER